MPAIPQIKCPKCKTSMPYTAAACPSCEHRMVTVSKPKEPYKTPEERAKEWSPKWADGQPQPMNRGLIGGIIAASILVVILFICCSSGNRTSEEQRAIDRYEEMKPVRDEMNRKMAEGKTREQAAQEIVNEEVLRQEINKMANQKK